MEYLIGCAVIALMCVIWWAIGALIVYWDLTWLRIFNSEYDFRYTTARERMFLNWFSGIMLTLIGSFIFILLVIAFIAAGEIGNLILDSHGM
jgi:hypothetical protein